MNQQWLLKMRPALECPVVASQKGILLWTGGGGDGGDLTNSRK